MSLLKPAVYGIIFSKDRETVLLIKRRDVPVWVLPGGGIDPGETPEIAVIREMKEETGYNIKILRQIAEYLPVNKLTQISFFYECEIISGEKTTGEETEWQNQNGFDGSKYHRRHWQYLFR